MGIQRKTAIASACAFASLIALSCMPKATVKPEPQPVIPALRAPEGGVALADPASNLVVSLSKMISDRVGGWERIETPTTRPELEAQAREYLSFRSGRGGDHLVEFCEDDDGKNPFCPFILQAAGRHSHKGKGLRRLRSKKPPRVSKNSPRVREWAKLLGSHASPELTGKLTEALHRLDDDPEDTLDSELGKALKQVRHYENLRPVMDQLLAKTPEGDRLRADPASALLLVRLGMRAEEQLPDSAARALATELYQTAFASPGAKAGPSGAPAALIVRGIYRLALLKVWDRQYAQALPLFGQLLVDPAPYKESPVGAAYKDFRSRAMYWASYCAAETGQPMRAYELRAQLIREFPLSLHALFIDSGKAAIELVHRPVDPGVQLRSLKRPDLNFAVRAVEVLQHLDEGDASLEIINTLVVTAGDALAQSEPAFQLYVGVLLRRTDDVLTKFHVLSQLFRDHPGYISQSTLSMLYPTNRLEVVEKVDDHAGAKIDPFLVLSLMRQESAFNERALSTAGAVGLMQVMPATGRKYGHVNRRKLFDPQTNIRVGVQFFSKLLDRYDGDAEYSLAAYNAGPDRVDDWKKRYPIEDRLLFLDLIPFRETREYVASITRNYYFYLKLYDSSRQPEQSSFFPVFKKHAAR